MNERHDRLLATIKSDRNFRGEVREGSNIWLCNLILSNVNDPTAQVLGKMEWPTLHAIVALEGRVSNDLLTFTAVRYIQRGSTLIGVNYQLELIGSHTLSGVWSYGSGRRGTATFTSTLSNTAVPSQQKSVKPSGSAMASLSSNNSLTSHNVPRTTEDQGRGQRGTTYTYTNGSFKGAFTALGDGEWEERAADGVYHFREQGSDSRGPWIYLRDASRNINVRIPVGGGTSSFQWGTLQRQGVWYKLYTVSAGGKTDLGIY
jgi:hypothetical protein